MNTILKEFDLHGRTASYHYADDTCKEWHLGDKFKEKAMRLYRDNPDLQKEMRKIAKVFLWNIKY